jgi:hypothetical protein
MTALFVLEARRGNTAAADAVPAYPAAPQDAAPDGRLHGGAQHHCDIRPLAGGAGPAGLLLLLLRGLQGLT